MGTGSSVMKKAQASRSAADDLFNAVDANHDGHLELDEVYEAIKSYGDKASKDWEMDAIRDTVARFDTNGDGVLDRDEFQNVLDSLNDAPGKRAEPRALAQAAGILERMEGARAKEKEAVARVKANRGAAESLKRYVKPDEALKALESGDVQLISKAWLMGLGREGKPLPRRQDLPKEALVTAADVKAWMAAVPGYIRAKVLPIIAISYCWLDPEHPDAEGKQVRMVAEQLEKHFEDFQGERYFPDYGVFWDWASIYQEHGGPGRTPEQYESFKRALTTTMDLWYAHSGTVVFFVTALPEGTTGVRPYKDRGWTTFERCCAELMKPNNPYVEYEADDGDGEYLWNMCLDMGFNGDADEGRKMPVAPDTFAVELGKKTFTNNADKDTVAGLYNRLAQNVLAGIEALELDYLVMRPGDGAALAKVISLCTKLREISLSEARRPEVEIQSLFGGVAHSALATVQKLYLCNVELSMGGLHAVMDTIATGAMPALRLLDVSENQALGDPGAVKIAQVIGTGVAPSLETLNIETILMGERGGLAIVQALSKGATPMLDELNLEDNQLTAKVASALVGALQAGALPKLKRLNLDKNKFGQDGANVLVDVFLGGIAPRLEQLALKHNGVDWDIRRFAKKVEKLEKKYKSNGFEIFTDHDKSSDDDDDGD